MIGYEKVSQTSPMEYWLLISGCAAFLIVVCYVTHINIALPAMNATQKITDAVRKKYDAVKKVFISRAVQAPE